MHLGAVVEITHHHLQVSLEKACPHTDKHESHAHEHDCRRICTCGNGKAEIADEHHEDTQRDALVEPDSVGDCSTRDWKEVDEH